MSPAQAVKVADLIDKARLLMNSRGKHWIQKQETLVVGPNEYAYCMIGAIKKLTRGERLRADAYIELSKTIVENTDRSWYMAQTNIVDFNDKPGRKWSEVSRVLRNTSARLRREAKKATQ